MSTVLPEGIYKAKATDCGMKKSSQKQTLGFDIQFKVSSGEHAGARARYTGWLTDAALPYTIESVSRLGWEGDDFSLITLDDLPNEVEIEVEHDEVKDEETGETKVYANVKYINGNGGGLKKMDEAEAKMAAGALKAKVAALRGGKKPAKPNGAPKQAAPTTDQDIPF